MLAAIYGLCLALMLVMRLAPDSWLGGMLVRQLVERPLRLAADLERHHLIYVVILAGFMIGGGEVFAVLGPELVAAYALNSAIYFDAVLVAYTLAAVSLARESVRYARLRLRPAEDGVLYLAENAHRSRSLVRGSGLDGRTCSMNASTGRRTAWFPAQAGSM